MHKKHFRLADLLAWDRGEHTAAPEAVQETQRALDDARDELVSKWTDGKPLSPETEAMLADLATVGTNLKKLTELRLEAANIQAEMGDALRRASEVVRAMQEGRLPEEYMPTEAEIADLQERANRTAQGIRHYEALLSSQRDLLEAISRAIS